MINNMIKGKIYGREFTGKTIDEVLMLATVAADRRLELVDHLEVYYKGMTCRYARFNKIVKNKNGKNLELRRGRWV